MTDGAEETARARRRPAALALGAVLLALFGLQLWRHAAASSPTLDEPDHLLAGYRYWQCGDFGINVEHPPLSKLLAAWPIRSRPLDGPPWPCGTRFTPREEGFQEGTRFAIANGVDRVVFPARLTTVAVSLLFAVLVALAALETFGPVEALLALALVAFEPTLVAHGSLVTNDMLTAASVFATAYLFYRWSRRPGALRLVAAGLALGVALATKHVALVLAPMLCLLPAVDALLAARREKTDPRRPLGRAALAGVAAGVVGLAVLWASYGFRYAALPNDPGGGATSVREIFSETPQPDSPAASLVSWVETSRVVPQAYAWGLAYVAGFSDRPTYLFGARLPSGVWYYFPVAFVIKTSLPLLVLLLVAFLDVRRLAGERPREALFLLVPPIAFFALAMTSSLNIGVRHVLPVYPFAAVFAAAGAVALARRGGAGRRRAVAAVLGVLLAYHAVTAWRTSPNDIAFANDLWGGTDDTYRLLHDSNVDWGQNLYHVSEYLDREGISDCWYACYGNGELAAAVVPRARLLPAPGWTNGDTPVPAAPAAIDGTVLVSANVLADQIGDIYRPITKTEPVAVIGGGVLVYRGHFEVPELSAISHLDRATQLSRLGRLDEAVEDARAAVGLVPGDAWARLALGTALARVGKIAEARTELDAAVSIGKADPATFGPAGEQASAILARLPR